MILRRAMIVCTSTALVAGCAAKRPQAVSGPLPSSDPIELAADAFASGMAAEGRSAPELGRAALVLTRLGVRPADAAARDLVAEWRTEAKVVDVAPLRGRALGAGYTEKTVAPAATLTLDQVYRGGEIARVTLAPGPKSRIEMSVTGRDGEVVCRKIVERSPGGCSWVPVFTSRHRFELRNVAAGPARVVVLTN